MTETSEYVVDYSVSFAIPTPSNLTFGPIAKANDGELTREEDTDNSFVISAVTREQDDPIKVFRNESFSVTANASCSINTTSTTMIYDMVPNGDAEFPDWITFDIKTGSYEGTAPYVRKETQYSFKLQSTWIAQANGSSEQVVSFSLIIQPNIEI